MSLSPADFATEVENCDDCTSIALCDEHEAKRILIVNNESAIQAMGEAVNEAFIKGSEIKDLEQAITKPGHAHEWCDVTSFEDATVVTRCMTCGAIQRVSSIREAFAARDDEELIAYREEQRREPELDAAERRIRAGLLERSSKGAAPLVTLGMRVRSVVDLAGVNKGTEGVVDELYDGGFMVAWDMPDAPLPIGYVEYDGRPAVASGILRDGFSYNELNLLVPVIRKRPTTKASNQFEPTERTIKLTED